MSKRILLLVLIFSLVLSGHAIFGKELHYELFVFLPENPQFNPTEDIFSPNYSSDKYDSNNYLSLSTLSSVSLASVKTAMVPIFGNFALSDADKLKKNITGEGITNTLATAAKLIQQEFVKNLKTKVTEMNAGLNGKPPLTFQYLLIPWKDKKYNYYYDKTKINLGGSAEASSYLAALSNYCEKVDSEIKNLISKNPDKVYFIALNTKLIIEFNKSRIEMQLLMGLKKNLKVDFVQEQSPVRLECVTTPVDQKIIAAITVTQPLYENTNNVTAHTEFGLYNNYNKDKKVFVLERQKINGDVLRLEGYVKTSKLALKQVAINFNFAELDFDLIKQKATNVDVFVSVGFDIGRFRKTFFSLHVTKVDNQFKDAINVEIDTNKQKLSDQVNGILNSDPIKLINAIFASR